MRALHGIGIELQVRSYEERSFGSNTQFGDARAYALIEVAKPGAGGDCYGVGIDENIVTASIKAMVSALNRAGGAALATDRPHAA